MELPSLLELLKAGVHFGHRSSRWYPKMSQYIFGTRNNVHIVDLEKTLAKLKEAADFIRETVARGGVVLFVGTKTQAAEIVKRHAIDCGMPYVTNRWLGGTLTNFKQIRSRIKHFLDLKEKHAKGELQKYTKKEQLLFAREIEDLDEKIGGISSLQRVPNALFVVDVKDEETAVREAENIGIKVVAICDTNINPDPIAYCIPGNDDAVKSIELVTRVMAEAVKEGLEQAKTRANELREKEVNETIKAKPIK